MVQEEIWVDPQVSDGHLDNDDSWVIGCAHKHYWWFQQSKGTSSLLHSNAYMRESKGSTWASAALDGRSCRGPSMHEHEELAVATFAWIQGIYLGICSPWCRTLQRTFSCMRMKAIFRYQDVYATSSGPTDMGRADWVTHSFDTEEHRHICLPPRCLPIIEP